MVLVTNHRPPTTACLKRVRETSCSHSQAKEHEQRQARTLTNLTAYQYIVNRDHVREALSAFNHQSIIGLDTETYWDPSTRQNRVSLLQLAAPTGEIMVIDALQAGLEEARELIENSMPLMAAHNARFDAGVLSAAGFAPAGLMDTLRLARLALRLPSFRLSAVT